MRAAIFEDGIHVDVEPADAHRVGLAAVGLYQAAASWSGKNGTDGLVPTSVLVKELFAGWEEIEALVKSGALIHTESGQWRLGGWLGVVSCLPD